MAAKVTNPYLSPITVPWPYDVAFKPGEARLANMTAAEFVASIGGANELAGLRVADVPDDGPYTLEARSAALVNATRLIHVPTITPSDSKEQPGQGPTPIAYGSVMGLHYDNANDQAFRIIKIPSSFVSDATFHVHWTKAVDTDQSGGTIRWKIYYLVFNGESVDVNVAPAEILLDDTYDDAGTTSRIVYRTPNVAAVGITAGSYLGVRLEYVAASTTLVGGPVVISADLLMRETINEGN